MTVRRYERWIKRENWKEIGSLTSRQPNRGIMSKMHEGQSKNKAALEMTG